MEGWGFWDYAWNLFLWVTLGRLVYTFVLRPLGLHGGIDGDTEEEKSDNSGS